MKTATINILSRIKKTSKSPTDSLHPKRESVDGHSIGNEVPSNIDEAASIGPVSTTVTVKNSLNKQVGPCAPVLMNSQNQYPIQTLAMFARSNTDLPPLAQGSRVTNPKRFRPSKQPKEVMRTQPKEVSQTQPKEESQTQPNEESQKKNQHKRKNSISRFMSNLMAKKAQKQQAEQSNQNDSFDDNLDFNDSADFQKTTRTIPESMNIERVNSNIKENESPKQYDQEEQKATKVNQDKLEKHACTADEGMDQWHNYMMDMNYFSFMDRSMHCQNFQKRKRAAQKARIARQAFKVGVSRVKDMIRAKKSQSMDKSQFMDQEANKEAKGVQMHSSLTLDKSKQRSYKFQAQDVPSDNKCAQYSLDHDQEQLTSIKQQQDMLSSSDSDNEHQLVYRRKGKSTATKAKKRNSFLIYGIWQQVLDIQIWYTRAMRSSQRQINEKQLHDRILCSFLGLYKINLDIIFQNSIDQYKSMYEKNIRQRNNDERMKLENQSANTNNASEQTSQLPPTPSISDCTDSLSIYNGKFNDGKNVYPSFGQAQTQNIQNTMDFLSSVGSIQERATIVNQCCIDRNIAFFPEDVALELLKAEVTLNGFGSLYYPDDQLDATIESKIQILLKRHEEDENLLIPFEQAELIAILIFTHERQDLYVNLKTTMTGKGIKKNQINQLKQQTNLSPSSSYSNWKQRYEENGNKKPCKWPVMQTLLQFSVVKIAFNMLNPSTKLLNYGLQFLIIKVDENSNQFVFDFEPASTTPFSSCPNISLIESIKIFGQIRMQFVTFVDIQAKESPKIVMEPDNKQPKKSYNWRNALQKSGSRQGTQETAKESLKSTEKGNQFYRDQTQSKNKTSESLETKSNVNRSDSKNKEAHQSQLSSLLMQRKMQIQTRKIENQNKGKTERKPPQQNETGMYKDLLPTADKGRKSNVGAPAVIPRKVPVKPMAVPKQTNKISSKFGGKVQQPTCNSTTKSSGSVTPTSAQTLIKTPKVLTSNPQPASSGKTTTQSPLLNPPKSTSIAQLQQQQPTHRRKFNSRIPTMSKGAK